MDVLRTFLSETDLTFPVVAFRLLLSFLLGGIIGYERERHNQPAGFRTHILITLGSAMLMILSIFVPRELGTRGLNGGLSGDPGRIAAQVVSGIGFLGAGAILKLGVNVRGVTTAASIWTVAALGLTVGAGMYATALFGTALIMFVLVVLDRVEKKVFTEHYLRSIDIVMKTGEIRTEEIISIIHKHQIHLRAVDISQSFEEELTKMKILVKIPENLDVGALFTELRQIDSISKVNLKRDV